MRCGVTPCLSTALRPVGLRRVLLEQGRQLVRGRRRGVRSRPRSIQPGRRLLCSSRHVEIRIHGETIADTTRPILLFETGLPTRYYIPKLDVRLDLLVPSTLNTACPYKGVASYFSVAVPGAKVVDDIVWVYPAPIPQIPSIVNHLCFFNEHVDVIVDGEQQERPKTKWS